MEDDTAAAKIAARVVAQDFDCRPGMILVRGRVLVHYLNWVSQDSDGNDIDPGAVYRVTATGIYWERPK